MPMYVDTRVHVPCGCACAAVRIALLTFTSLGWRVPVRLHLLLQSINVGLLIVYGLHPYCQSKVG